MYEAKIIKDSICAGHRLTTIQVTHPRIIHAEVMTHCMFARNASSSRAIPFNVSVKRVVSDTFSPVYWGSNQKGMQAGEELTGYKKQRALGLWLQARDQMIAIATEMASYECTHCRGAGNIEVKGFLHTRTVTCDICDGTGEGLNVHKQIVNRLLEPWSWITVCVTGDAGAWSNYFALRNHKDAQPEIATQARMAVKAYFESVPEVLKKGQWHLPYVQTGEFNHLPIEEVVKISVGRCARTSLLTQEGKREPEADITLHDRLFNSTPKHASPFEHVCKAMGNKKRYAKYIGWQAYRNMIPNEYITDYKPEDLNVNT